VPKQEFFIMATQHQKTSNKATTDHSAKAQCQIFLAYLIKHGFISSINARKFLDIIWSPARVHELKKQGYQDAVIVSQLVSGVAV
jgi:hypothetical protein